MPPRALRADGDLTDIGGDGLWLEQVVTTVIGALTDKILFPMAPFAPSNLSDPATTDGALCAGALKLQSPLTPAVQRSASQLEIWSLAHDAKFMSPGFSFGLKFSDLPGKTLLSTHAAPLPIFQVRQPDRIRSMTQDRRASYT